ncbi:MAG: oligosaccharide flippase family protein, partial [Lachnoclostridium sp.]|nr:oligosaccharide flippase family protein [Lachnoclostridium sp.]
MSQPTKDRNVPQRKGQGNFLKQGGILAAASILVRFIGMLYRIPMANIIGEEGNGIYAVAFELYDMILIISSYSLPLALSKIISALTVKRQYINIGKTFRLASVFALLSGGMFGTALFFSANIIEKMFYDKYEGIHIPLKILAPTIFIVAFLGVFRGFFQGKKTMIPTAVSQILEQIINAVTSILCAYIFVGLYKDTVYKHAWGAAGGTAGTCLGAFVALLFMLF